MKLLIQDGGYMDIVKPYQTIHGIDYVSIHPLSKGSKDYDPRGNNPYVYKPHVVESRTSQLLNLPELMSILWSEK